MRNLAWQSYKDGECVLAHKIIGTQQKYSHPQIKITMMCALEQSAYVIEGLPKLQRLRRNCYKYNEQCSLENWKIMRKDMLHFDYWPISLILEFFVATGLYAMSPFKYGGEKMDGLD